MEEVFVKMGESIYPIRVNIALNTFLDLYDEILYIFCGYEMTVLIRHFAPNYPDKSETLASKGIAAGHIFEIPMHTNVIYR